MSDINLGLNGGVPPRTGNAPDSGIDFRDWDYIHTNEIYLQMEDWQEAEKKFSAEQPEIAKIASFEEERHLLAIELQPLREEKDQLAEHLEKQTQAQKHELDMLEEIAVLKSSLLSILPEKFRGEGRAFLNNFILRHNEQNYMPAEGPAYEGLKAKAEKLLFLPKLNRFKSEFLRLSQNFNSFEPRFDITLDKKAAQTDIEQYYNLADIKQRLEDICLRIARIEPKQQELAAAAGNERISLNNKVKRLRSYYDKKLYQPCNLEEVPFSSEKENSFAKYESPSQVWKNLMREARLKNIHFSETFGLLENKAPVAAMYEQRENRILCNKAFSVDEQIWCVADILFEKTRRRLAGDYDVKSQYLSELCYQAERTVRLCMLANELAIFLPIFKSRTVSLYGGEMSAYLSGDTPNNKYAKAFVKALSSEKVRQAAADKTINLLAENQKIIVQNNENYVPRSLTIGEVIAPFVSRGAPLYNENAEMRRQLGQIPAGDKNRIQDLANNDKDYSLIELNIY